jgi:hypothetical protein
MRSWSIFECQVPDNVGKTDGFALTAEVVAMRWVGEAVQAELSNW